MITVRPGTIAVFADIACPWAHATIYRLQLFREKAGLTGAFHLDIRAFPLELFNRRSTPKLILDAETSCVGAMEPGAGWQMWQRPEHEYPVTMLPPMEAVEAAKDQGLAASEQLDRALRVAFFGASRCISLRDVILDVAGTCDAVESGALAEALDSGSARRRLMEQKGLAEAAGVEGSPHLYLPDGSDVHNPGVDFHWEGEHGVGFPVVDHDDASVYEDLVRRAAG